MNRKLLLILGLVLLLLVGLAALYVYLVGGQTGREEVQPVEGLFHVRTMYTADGENLRRPVGLGAADDGRFIVTLRDNQRIVMFERNGDWVRTWGARGLDAGQLMSPVGAAFDPATDHVYITDRARLRLIAYSSEGRYLWEIPMLNPLTPAVTPDGVVVTTFGPIVKFNSQGQTVREVATRGHEMGQFDYPRGIAMLNKDEAIVADTNNLRIQRIRISGTVTATAEWVYGNLPVKQDDPDTVFGLPSSVALDDQGRAYVLDGFRHAIVVMDATTGKEIHAYKDLQGDSDARFNLPSSIAYLGGNYFAITDTYNDRVQIIRILLPGEDNVLAKYPWLLWLLPLLLLPLLLLFGRKKYYVTDATLVRAYEEKRLRLLAAVAKKVYVTPEAKEHFKDVVEEEVEIDEYLVAVGETGEPATADDRLLDALPAGRQRLLLPRVRLVCVDEAQCEELDGKGRKAVDYDELIEEYQLEGEATTAIPTEVSEANDTE